MNKIQRFLFETRIGDQLLGMLEKHIGLTVGVAELTSVATGFVACRPRNEQRIEVQYPSGDWVPATYHDDGAYGIIVDKYSITEIAERPHVLWRSVE